MTGLMKDKKEYSKYGNGDKLIGCLIWEARAARIRGLRV